MCNQFKEIIFYDGTEHYMSSDPFSDLVVKKIMEGKQNEIPQFRWPHTALWRGYVGTWEIFKNKLYLRSLKCYPKDSKTHHYFNYWSKPTEVFAKWYSGEIRIEKWRLNQQQACMLLQFHNGELIDT